MDKKDTNKLFNVVTEVGLAQASEILTNLRHNHIDEPGTFLDGFQYAITALETTKKMMEEDDGQTGQSNQDR